MDWIIIFCASFLAEVALCLYTRAVAIRNIMMGTIMSPICRVFAFIGILSTVQKPILLIPLLAGEALATYIVLKYSK